MGGCEKCTNMWLLSLEDMHNSVNKITGVHCQMFEKDLDNTEYPVLN